MYTNQINYNPISYLYFYNLNNIITNVETDS